MPVNVVAQGAISREAVRLLDGPAVDHSPDDLDVRLETADTLMVTPRLKMLEFDPRKPVEYAGWFEARYQRVGDTPEYRHAPGWKP